MISILKKLSLLVFLFTIIGTTDVQAQKKGRKAKTHKMRSSSSSNGEYYNGHKIYTGPRGGKYYINKNGNKTYI